MQAYNLSNLSVLVVDDNRLMRNLVRSVLFAFGVDNIEEASDGATALEALQKFPADIVITDWQMGPVDGLDFTRIIRTADDSPNPYLPIVMLTGHTEVNRVEEARDAGVTEFLAKPVSSWTLYKRLVKLVEQPRPFIRTRAFTGPDRRWRDCGPCGPERRAVADVQICDLAA
jgi:two-component system chemotaxis response regulator CheY